MMMSTESHSLKAISQLTVTLSRQQTDTLQWLADLKLTLQSVEGVPYHVISLVSAVLVVNNSPDIVTSALETLGCIVKKDPSLVRLPFVTLF